MKQKRRCFSPFLLSPSSRRAWIEIQLLAHKLLRKADLLADVRHQVFKLHLGELEGKFTDQALDAVCGVFLLVLQLRLVTVQLVADLAQELVDVLLRKAGRCKVLLLLDQVLEEFCQLAVVPIAVQLVQGDAQGLRLGLVHVHDHRIGFGFTFRQQDAEPLVSTDQAVVPEVHDQRQNQAVLFDARVQGLVLLIFRRQLDPGIVRGRFDLRQLNNFRFHAFTPFL